MKKIIFIIPVILVMMWCDTSYADIYKYVDENGVIFFTNMPAGKGYKKIISEERKDINKHTLYDGGKEHRTKDYQQIIEKKSREYNIEPSLVRAVIKTESNWDSMAISQKGAMGLMQLMPDTAKVMEVKNPFNPEENIEGGIKYLRYLLDRFNGDLTLALAAYNAGPEKIKKFGGIPPIPETQRYVKQILSIHNNGDSSTQTSTVIYKVIYSDGSVLYTNTPLPYESLKLSRF
jgi:hypothetical protein